MSKKIIKATDKIINRYSKTGLEQVNLDKKQIKNISSKIQDVDLNTNKVFSQTNSNYEIGKSRKYKHSIQEQKTIDPATSGLISQATTQDLMQHSQHYAKQTNTNIGTQINSSYENNQNVDYPDMPYNKENLKNTYDGQFRQTNQILLHSTSSNDNTISSTTLNTKKSISRIGSYSNRLLDESKTQKLNHKTSSTLLKQKNKDVRLNIDNKETLKFESSKDRLINQQKNTSKLQDRSSYSKKTISRIYSFSNRLLDESKTQKLTQV